MIHLGMPALIEMDTVSQTAALCSELGLDFIELNTNFPNQQLHLLDTCTLKSLAKQHHLGYTIHLNDEMPVADFNPTVANGYLSAVLEAIDFAKEIEAPVINMHISEGAHYTRPDGIVYFYDAYRADYLQRIAAFRDACQARIGEDNVRICMENSKAYFDFQRAALDILLESPVFNLTLDVGHNYCSGFSDEDWIFARQDRLRHLHIHDARNGTQDHLPLGDGEIQLGKYFRFADENSCSVVLEVKTVNGLRTSAKRLGNYLERKKTL